MVHWFSSDKVRGLVVRPVRLGRRYSVRPRGIESDRLDHKSSLRRRRVWIS